MDTIWFVFDLILVLASGYLCPYRLKRVELRRHSRYDPEIQMNGLRWGWGASQRFQAQEQELDAHEMHLDQNSWAAAGAESEDLQIR